jgi:two-component system, chemotaxis family, chemotaxis protein CheY
MSKRLLIVDDSPVMRSFIRRIIAISGFDASECREASNGLEALEALERSPADLVLTDVNMPGMDGEQLVRSMKANRQFAGIPIVVVSTDATESRVSTLLRLGASGYLTKPFVPERLSEVLTDLTGEPEEKAEEPV